ncbi:MAG: immune inhibitor A [Caldilineaceae bacterium]|nr:immune inhibitor A [Caldilineaceae bacterium]
MKQTRNVGLAVGIVWVALLLGACTLRWGLQSDPLRPVATPTRYLGADPGGGLLQPVPVATPPLLSTDELVKLSTAEQMAVVVAPARDVRDLAMRFKPELGEIPLVVNERTPDYNVGDRLEFWAHNMGNGTNFTVTAELIHKTDVAYVWVEAGQRVDVNRMVEAVDRFSTQSYPSLRAFFGSEWKPGVDNDPRLHILHARGLGSGIAGYYSSSDEYSRLAQPHSNEKEMFYIDLDWATGLFGASAQSYDTVLAHEFQHMVHWHTDRNEETWVNEGLSEFAQDVAGFGPTITFSRDFIRVPDTQLNSWGIGSAGNNAHYGAAYLFMAYFAQRFGPELTRALVAHPANGILGFDDVLAATESGITFDDLFADWVVANYVDDPDALGREGLYGYRSFNQEQPPVDASYDEYPTVLRQSTVANYGTDYLLLEGEGDLVFHFRGDAMTQLADLQSTTPRYFWWSNRGDNSDVRLTRHFDLSSLPAGTPIEMTAGLWWEIEQGYDFAYVAASRDGETWTILPGSSTLESDSSNALGPGYTGSSDGWRTERFDLSAYAGEEVAVRFEYVTDDALNRRGLFVKEIAIPAIEYASDFEQGADGWESEGWLFTDNQLRQDWIVQLLTLENGTLTGIERAEVDAQGRVSLPVPGLGAGRSAVIAISGAAPVMMEAAPYEYWIDLQQP